MAADIYDEASASISGLGLDTECLGGGRIEHFPEKKFLKVYGHSTVRNLPTWIFIRFLSHNGHDMTLFLVLSFQGFGKGDHAEARRILLTKYPTYEIEISDEGY